MVWMLVFIGPLLVGAACGLMLPKKPALIASVVLPWTLVLIFNLYTEYYGVEKELLQGTWPFFQLTLGTAAGLIGLIGRWIAVRLRNR